jgi:G3E family GTPase
MSVVQVAVFVGFLGAGKTSLILNLRADLERSDFIVRVIVNDFSDVNIDAALLSDVSMANGTPIAEKGEAGGDDAVIDIAGGCICCGLLPKFLDTAAKCIRELAIFDRPGFLFVESTGIGDAGPIVHGLVRRAAADGLTIAVREIVAVLDCVGVALLVRDPLRELLVEQLSWSTTVVLTRANNDSTPAQRGIARALIDEANVVPADWRLARRLRVLAGDYGKVSALTLFCSLDAKAPRVLEPSRYCSAWEAEVAVAPHESEATKFGFRSVTLVARGVSFDADVILTEVSSGAVLDGVLRSKGYVMLNGQQHTWTSCGRRFTYSEVASDAVTYPTTKPLPECSLVIDAVAGGADSREGGYTTFVVFIGRGVNTAKIMEGFNKARQG